MSEHSEELLQFKAKVERELEHATEEIKRLRKQIEKLELDQDKQAVQVIASGDDTLKKQLKRLRELLNIQLDHKERLTAEILRISDRNPGLLRPEFKKPE